MRQDRQDSAELAVRIAELTRDMCEAVRDKESYIDDDLHFALRNLKRHDFTEWNVSQLLFNLRR